MLYKWKRETSCIADKSISERDMLQLQEASQYPEFVLLVLKDGDIQRAFMEWVFRDGNQTKVFIEYPQLREKLVACNLNGRMGKISAQN